MWEYVQYFISEPLSFLYIIFLIIPALCLIAVIDCLQFVVCLLLVLVCLLLGHCMVACFLLVVLLDVVFFCYGVVAPLGFLLKTKLLNATFAISFGVGTRACSFSVGEDLTREGLAEGRASGSCFNKYEYDFLFEETVAVSSLCGYGSKPLGTF